MILIVPQPSNQKNASFLPVDKAAPGSPALYDADQESPSIGSEKAGGKEDYGYSPRGKTGRCGHLFYLDGENAAALPLIERKARLAELLAGAGPPLHYSDYHRGRGPAFHEQACKLELEAPWPIIYCRPRAKSLGLKFATTSRPRLTTSWASGG